MLIGPSITLEKLEEHMKNRVYEIKMDLPKLEKEFRRLGEEFKMIPRTIINEEGEEITNPDFIAIPKRMREIEEAIQELQDQQEFMEAKLMELEDIEERSKGRGNVIKSRDKIILSLNDCIKLGITLNEETKA
ncbi:MAG TPA: hypothetical protein VEY51_05845 [Chondromyces sp.]|nr:hypothetical protein [Chondromyces sp.]